VRWLAAHSVGGGIERSKQCSRGKVPRSRKTWSKRALPNGRNRNGRLDGTEETAWKKEET
ncbi:hypothetical protein, partial [Bifidobacterium adolescentis]|uniref:hypothetical protein n=1 Tax=Bifidobacterium adolescentis TaxID=1680 RepID=UPI00321B3409